jgi:hypothetical protein
MMSEIFMNSMNTELNIPENKIASKETGFPDWLTHSNV